MSIFLRTVNVEEAIRVAKGIAPHPGREEVPLEEAAGRVLAEAVAADVDIPAFDRSVVDGYAVRASDTIGAGESIPSLLTLMGTVGWGRPRIWWSVPENAHTYPPAERSPQELTQW